MTHFCLYIAAVGIAFAALLYIAVKFRWRIARPMCRHAPRLASVAAAFALLLFVLQVTGGTGDLADAFNRNLQNARYALQNLFSHFKF